MIGHRHWAIP